MSSVVFDRFQRKAGDSTANDVDALAVDQADEPPPHTQEYIDAFLRWRADDENKLSVAIADERIDVLMGVHIVVPHVQTFMPMEDNIRDYLVAKAYGIKTKDVAGLEEFYLERWNALATNVLRAEGAPADKNDMFSHVLTYGDVVRVRRLHPLQIWGCYDIIVETLRDAVHESSTTFAVERANDDSLPVIFTNPLRGLLLTVLNVLTGQIIAYEAGPYKDLKISVQVPAAEFTPLPEPLRKIFKECSTQVVQDLKINASYTRLLSARLQDRLTIYQRAWDSCNRV